MSHSVVDVTYVLLLFSDRVLLIGEAGLEVPMYSRLSLNSKFT